MPRFPLARAVAFALVAATCIAGCSSGSSFSTDTSKPATIRLGYFPNVTHSSAIVGVEQGYFQRALGKNHLETKLFNAGGDAVIALFSGAIDAAYLGPNVAANAFQKSGGEAVRVVSGATSGGARFIVSKSVQSVSDLKGRTISTPQLGATQDVAARTWLHSQGLKVDLAGGGDVAIVPQENSRILAAFQDGRIDGAWVPEPWATRLELEAGGHELVDERELWPEGQFATTLLLVSTELLERRPDLVRALVDGQVAASAFIADHPDKAQEVVRAAITKYTGKELPREVMTSAWKHLTFTNDPMESALSTAAANAAVLGFLDSASVKGVYSLDILNATLGGVRPKVVGTK